MTVALVVIAFVAIGLYYASLETGTQAPTPTTADNLVRADAEADPPGVRSLVAPATIDPGLSEQASTGNATPGAPTFGQPRTPGAGELPSLGQPSANGRPTGEAQPSALSGQPEEGAASAGEEAAIVDDDLEGEESVADAGASEEEPPVSLGVPARGSVMLLLADPFLAEFDRDDALASFEKGGDDNSPEGTAWVKLSEWVIVPQGEPAPWITADANDATWVLVEDTGADRVDLDGKVFTAGERLDSLRGEPIVTFVLKDEGAESMGGFTYPNLGREFALVVDGEVVVVQLIRTAIEARGTLVPTCDRAQAQWIAARLRDENVDRPASAAGESGVAMELTEDTTGASPELDAEPGTVQGTPAGDFGSWTIAEGDTFTSIAEAWFGDPNKWTLIAKANPLVDPGRMTIGQVIKLPPKETLRTVDVKRNGEHVVESGETLSEIALAYYGKARFWREIYDANRAMIGDDPAELIVGMRLVMPKIND
ncbi:MAG: LysM peptidoglycan-binding domain-containing protein [Phycisphaerales bacterium]|nr:LysM peptidoglycan-binding domain-containing protein [Phycisphaerales bacterium]